MPGQRSTWDAKTTPAQRGAGHPGLRQISRLPATLIVHGEADAVVPVQEAHAMEAIARTRAATYSIKLYPGAGHGFDTQADDAQAIDARKQVIDFLVRHLKPGSK